MTPLSFVRELSWNDLPDEVQHQTKLCLMDLIGVGIAGRGTELSQIVHAYAQAEHPGGVPLPFDSGQASATGAALAYGMTIDSIDAHEGFNPAKGHLGCPLWPAVFVNCQEASGSALLSALAMGYEFGARCSIAQHGSVSDYHTSGSWGAVAAAAASARLIGLDPDQTRHALGIAEYHGPRSQMMRVIDHPTMLKDGSGWGAMCGVSAARLAKAGFTGAPAVLVAEQPEVWADLGARWYILEQYFKPYPICRWAQAPVEAALTLQHAHDLSAEDIAGVTIATFHEAIRLAHPSPATTEEAQYSTSFPVAAALVHGALDARHIMPDALRDPRVLQISQSIQMVEDDQANARFPLQRIAKVTLRLRDGRELNSDWTEPKWEHTAPPSAADLSAKFMAYASPVVGQARAARIVATIDDLETRPAADLLQLFGPI